MILIIDDDAAVRSSLGFLLKHAGFETQAVAGPQEALDTIRTVAPQLILMDMNFSLGTSGEEGIRLLRQVRIFQPDTPVILITAWGSISLAVEGMRAGASDFVTKPWDNVQLLNVIRTTLALSEQKKNENLPFNRGDSRFNKIIGKSAALTEALGIVSRIAPTNASVLITGESGTGKELIAEALHANSPRAKEPFVKVNLGGLAQSLFESEMFGHRKGAFTDACIDRTGRFEMADKGTIFLDEIGDLEYSSQVKLLRVLHRHLRLWATAGPARSMSAL
jgi:two-component system NtrC family response regulator